RDDSLPMPTSYCHDRKRADLAHAVNQPIHTQARKDATPPTSLSRPLAGGRAVRCCVDRAEYARAIGTRAEVAQVTRPPAGPPRVPAGRGAHADACPAAAA